MHITVLTVPDCPNAPLAQERVARALDGRSAEVELVEVTGEEQAARLGMTGSPTILIDGTDPFAAPGATASVSCRLYRGPDGRTVGAPSVADLRRVLLTAEAITDGESTPLDGRGRLAPVAGGLRAVQRAVLRHFAATGRAPEPDDLATAAAGCGRDVVEVLAELAAEDFLTLDADGQIRAAYPFSAVPTPHQIRLPDRTTLWAMCAIDALGIPAMLGADAVIASSDPVTGERITITSSGGHTTWQPATAVVHIGQLPCTGPAADVTCRALNFFTSSTTARTWVRHHPDVTGRTVGQARAEALGRTVFGSLLTASDH